MKLTKENYRNGLNQNGEKKMKNRPTRNDKKLLETTSKNIVRKLVVANIIPSYSSDIEAIIVICLSHGVKDAYKIGKEVDDRTVYKVDTKFIQILDNLNDIWDSCYNEMIAKWTKENINDRVVDSWMDLKKMDGSFVTSRCDILNVGGFDCYSDNKNIFPSELDCKKVLAEAQLRQIAKRANDGELEEYWLDWDDYNQIKCYPVYDDHTKAFKIYEVTCLNTGSIYFKRKEDLKQSIKKHEKLWKQYFKIVE